MREYLFRGKRLDNGEWVEGYYFKHDTVKVLLSSDDPETKHFILKDGFCDWGLEPPMQGYEVDPETVGQYTGLENMNGVKIFDGDIVMFHEKKYIVRREDEIPGGYWWSTAYILQEVGVDDYLSFEETVDEYCNEICVEVIGNIHDNPELLKGVE